MTGGLLAGRRVLVVGAASGIGRATAIAAVAAGARVAAVDRDADGLASLADAFRSGEGGVARAGADQAPAGAADARRKGPGELVVVRRADITDDPAVAGAVDAAAVALGGLDAVLHVAGIMRGQQLPVTELPLDVWHQVIAVNLTGAFLVARHATPHLAAAARAALAGPETDRAAAQAGTAQTPALATAGDRLAAPAALVFVASRAGVVAPSGSVAYGASKGGLHGLALTLAPSLRARGIRVHTLCPGDIDTPLMRRSLAEAAANGADASRIAAVRDGLDTPEHVADVLVLLASTAAGGLAGTVFSS